MSDSLDAFFRYNLPLQVMPGDDNGGATKILLYLPRKERTNGWADLADMLPEGATREQFFNRAAEIFDNLAKLMRHAGGEPRALIHYPDDAPSVVEGEDE
jgi:hypothetical protein